MAASQNLPISKEHFSQLAEGISIQIGKTYQQVLKEKVWVDEAVGEELWVTLDAKAKELLPRLASEIENKNHPRKREALLRLALHKKPTGIGQATMNAYMDDLASDLAQFSALAIELACTHIRRSHESPFFPQSKTIFDTSEAIQKSFAANMRKDEPRIEKGEKFYRDQKENPVRRKLCDFLISKGCEDLFNDQMYTNYQLEIMAKSKYAYIEMLDAAE